MEMARSPVLPTTISQCACHGTAAEVRPDRRSVAQGEIQGAAQTPARRIGHECIQGHRERTHRRLRLRRQSLDAENAGARQGADLRAR